MEIFNNTSSSINIYITICHPKLISTTQNYLGTLEFRLWEDFVQT